MMFTSRWFIYLILIVLLIDGLSFGQQEIRKAIKTKKNRKVKETKDTINRGKQHVQDATNHIRAPIDRATGKVNEKYQNTRKKIQDIETIIKS